MKAILVLISILVMGNSARAQVDWIRFASLSDSMRETPKTLLFSFTLLGVITAK